MGICQQVLPSDLQVCPLLRSMSGPGPGTQGTQHAWKERRGSFLRGSTIAPASGAGVGAKAQAPSQGSRWTMGAAPDSQGCGAKPRPTLLGWGLGWLLPQPPGSRQGCRAMPQNRGEGFQHLLRQGWRKSSKWSCRVEGREAPAGLDELLTGSPMPTVRAR